MIIEAIQRYLQALPEDRDPRKISISSLGHCARQLAYRVHGTAGKELTWRAKALFDDGKLAHEQLRPWIRKGLIGTCYRLTGQEQEVSLPINQMEHVEIKGHIDGMLEHKKSCKQETHKDMLFEAKSMNPYAFKEFKDGHLEFSYNCQIQGYMKAYGLQQAVVLGKNKANFYLHQMTVDYDDQLLQQRVAKVQTVLQSECPEVIGGEYGPDAKGKLHWKCGHCPYVEECWKNNGVKRVADNVYTVKAAT